MDLDYRAWTAQVKRPPSLDILAGGRFKDELGVSELPSVRAGICGVGDDQVGRIALSVLLQPAEDETTEDQRPSFRILVLVVVDDRSQRTCLVRDRADTADTAVRVTA